MKISLLTLLLLSSVPVNAHDYQKGYTTQRICYKEIYKEEYVAGTKASQGYVKSFNDRVEVPCNRIAKVRHHHHHYYHHPIPTYNYSRTRYYQPSNTYRISRTNRSKSSCKSSTATGGLIGGGLAAALSKKDAYSWSIPLGAVVGMGLGSSDC